MQCVLRMEKQPGETVHIPIVPVNLYKFSNKIEVPRENITGGRLKETIQIQSSSHSPKNSQIVVVLNPERTLVEKIIHDETTLSPAELANVCILECRQESVEVHVEVRWPKHEGKPEATSETMRLRLSPDDQVSCIKKEIEKMNKLEIMDCVILLNGRVLESKEENKTLSYHSISSNSQMNVIITNFDSEYSKSSGIHAITVSLHLASV